MSFDVINPTTGECVKQYDQMTMYEVEKAIEQAQATFLEWKSVPLANRAAMLKTAAKILKEEADDFAQLMATEMGKPIKDGRAEAEKCAWVCDYYAQNGDNFLATENIETDAFKSFVTYHPLGVVLAVMPWNFPFWQVFRFTAPSLMAGNACVLKHASNVPGCALAIEDVFRRAGFPQHLFRTLLVSSKSVDAIIENPFVQAVTLTGSTPAGRAVAKKAGEMLKKTVLELGGSDPYLILEDANIETAAKLCARSRLINGGQSCISAKRFVVVNDVRSEFEKHLVMQMEAAKVGDPFDEETDIGPMARVDLRDELHDQVQQSISKGARYLLGGRKPDGKGTFYFPTVLTDVKPDMPAYDDELFGPVAAVIPVADTSEAIRAANDTSFGLGAAVFTNDLKMGELIATQKLDAGCCFVNDFVKSDPRLPFGGVKESGYGRELSHFGMREFVNIKTVSIA